MVSRYNLVDGVLSPHVPVVRETGSGGFGAPGNAPHVQQPD